jgi:hypothetical protein
MALTRQFRKNYTGEYMVDNVRIENGRRVYDRTFVPNTIQAQLSGYAVVLGNGPSRNWIYNDMEVFTRHHGGFGRQKRLTVYGCNGLHREAKPHYLVVRHPNIAEEVVKSGYADEHVVITSKSNLAAYPNKFHLTPYDPGFNAGATAAYLAAFDGNFKVFLVGIDFYGTPNNKNNIYQGTNGYYAASKPVNYTKMANEFKQVFVTYPEVEFVRIAMSKNSDMVPEWQGLRNVTQLSWHQFIKDMDIGMMT